MSMTGSMADDLGYQNPLRYRGYVYDTETNLYYLQSRYYDPQMCRFINADCQLNPQSGTIGMNMFAYCNNNPVMFTDSNGRLPFLAVTAIIGAVVGGIAGGIIAASNGQNVWAGIGIGAAAGGLIGLGAGAAAGALLAGSATASTASVIVGASGFISTVSSGGLIAGGKYLIDNLAQSITKSSQVVQSNTSNFYYQITSKVNAQKIIDSGTIVSQEGGKNSMVYALKFQPTIREASNVGARSVETVIRFTTNAGFDKDKTCAIGDAWVSTQNAPINVFNIVEVGFRK